MYDIELMMSEIQTKTETHQFPRTGLHPVTIKINAMLLVVTAKIEVSDYLEERA